MQQLTFTLNKVGDISNVIDDLKKNPHYNENANIYAEILLRESDKKGVDKIVNTLKKEIKNIRIAGQTALAAIGAGVPFEDKIVISFLIFESSHVVILDYDGDKYSEREIAQLLREDLNKIDDSVCVRLFVNALVMENESDFFENFTPDKDNLLFAGGVAAGTIPAPLDTYFLINDNGHQDKGVVAAVFCGKDLHARTAFAQGWEPSGLEHEITRIDNNHNLVEIDGMPATELYSKYLGVEINEFLPREVLEFPLMVNREGLQIARGVLGIQKNGALTVASDLREGDKVRLSVASVTNMLTQSQKNSAMLSRFQPESMFLTICVNRFLYMQDSVQQELDFYTSVMPELVGSSNTGEILRIGAKIYLLNCALVGMVMREGPKDNSKSSSISLALENYDATGHRPLIDKISYFMQTSTAEFVEKFLMSEIEAQKAANEAKSAFLSNVSHEIRTPINSVLGMDEMILRTTKEDKTKEYASNIKVAGNTLLYLINDILDFSKIEAGKMEIHPAEYSLSSLIYDLMIMARSRLTDKDLELIVDISETIPDKLFGDEVRIRQVLLNILTNAIKYTSEGSITLTAAFEKTAEDEAAITFHVIDTGQGIKPNDIKRLFDPFERINESRNRSIEGTGLGLNITQNLLSLMGTKLEVESTYGKGSDFFFTLKQEVLDWNGIGDFEKKSAARFKNETEEREGYIAPESHILIVDDTKENLMVTSQLLSHTQIKIDTALSGLEAIKLCGQNKYDIIFMDHRMPNIDGTETMQMIKSKNRCKINHETPIVVLTANVVSGMREKFLEDGFDDYLEKPVNPLLLDEMIKKYMPFDKIQFVKLSPEDIEEPLSKKEEQIMFMVSDISQLDTKNAIINCGGTKSYVKILNEFTNGAKGKQKQLFDFIEAGDYKNFGIKIHALKSEARLIGATTFSELCFRLEKAADNNDIDYIKSRFYAVMEWMDILLDDLLPLFAEGMDNDKEPIDDAKLAEAYSAMLEVAQVFDMTSVEWILNELLKFKIPESEQARINTIKQAVLEMDADTIVSTLKN